MSTFLHYVHCKDALLDCSAPGGERCGSLTWVDEIAYPCPYICLSISLLISLDHIEINMLKAQSLEISAHYSDVTMGAMVSQITSLAIVYSTVYSDADQRKHQSSESLAFGWGIHRWPVNSAHKWPVTQKIFPFDDVIMILHFGLSILLHGDRAVVKMEEAKAVSK